MRRSIERVPSDIGATEFAERFLEPDVPVIIQGPPIPAELSQRMSDRGILDRLQAREVHGNRNAIRHSSAWLDVTREGICQEPGLGALYQQLATLMPETGVRLRETHVRIWASPQGTVTTWHYDGNGVHGLNLQMTGRKHWQLVSPETPLPTYPFMFSLVQGAMPLNARQRNELEWMEFETVPGEVLFLPRLWAHQVISLEPWNLNVNLVFTSTSRPASALGHREEGRLASLAMIRRSPLWPLLPEVVREGATDGDDYGGDGDYFVGRVPRRDIARGFARELRKLPLAGFVLRYRKSLGIA